jgi:hypothetical protein
MSALAERTDPAVAERARRGLPARAARAAAWALTIAAVTCGGIGWLYLVRDTGALAAGPRIGDALPLQRLAGGADQPLLRLLAAWLPAGIAAGFALRAAGVGRRLPRASGMLAGCALLLMALGAGADTITASEPLRDHLVQQPQRAATWIAAVLVGLGAALP